jgi:2-polyprenyl-3-methyl-5-hydroxy-6-metoxy-1,4-benzoquinol methylase
MMKRIGRDVDSLSHWESIGASYSAALEDDYHAHRLTVIRKLIPPLLLQPGRQIFDFGCGDAILFAPFLRAGAHIQGVDVAKAMIDLAERRLRDDGHDPALAQLGGVHELERLPAASIDALLSFNVLAYLTDEEERLFYAQARRLVKPGGSLIVTHSNELFDLFSLNRYTAEFFVAKLVGPQFRDRIASLLTAGREPEDRSTYNVRENPLSYRFKLARWGFEEAQQEFINLHLAPPPLREPQTYPDTIGVSEEDRWKLMFTCSTYGSRAVRSPH